MKRLGHEVVTAFDIGLSNAPDHEIVDYAKDNELLFVTENNDAAQHARLGGCRYLHLDMVVKAKAVDREIRGETQRGINVPILD